jgi:hypothetical protein
VKIASYQARHKSAGTGFPIRIVAIANSKKLILAKSPSDLSLASWKSDLEASNHAPNVTCVYTDSRLDK